MKKHFLFMALAAMTLGFAACGSDDNGGRSNPNTTPAVNLPAAKNANNACDFNLHNNQDGTMKVIDAKTQTEKENPPRISEINIAEGGTGSVGMINSDGSNYFLSGEVTVQGNRYTFNGKKVKGTIVCDPIPATSRANASESVNLFINLTIILEDGSEAVYTTEEEHPMTATQNIVKGVASDSNLSYLARDWRILESEILLEGDVDAFKTFTGGDLAPIRKEAMDHGAEITGKDYEKLGKTIEYVSFTKSCNIKIVYTDGTVDGGDTKWSSSDYKTFDLSLKDKGMGSKFIADNAHCDILLFEDRCNLMLKTSITNETDKKKYDATLTLRMQAIK